MCSGCGPTSTTPPASSSSPPTSGPRSNAASNCTRCWPTSSGGSSAGRPASAGRRPATCPRGLLPTRRPTPSPSTSPDPTPSSWSSWVKLAGATALVVPAETPATDVGTRPVPATGPYMIQSFVPKGTVVLVRNPHFREWSRAAQPDGYPDRIEWTPSGQDSAVDAVLAGRADYYGLWKPPGGDRGEALTTRYASQTHRYP